MSSERSYSVRLTLDELGLVRSVLAKRIRYVDDAVREILDMETNAPVEIAIDNFCLEMKILRATRKKVVRAIDKAWGRDDA